jgi:hypothetical protein
VRTDAGSLSASRIYIRALSRRDLRVEFLWHES